MEFGNRGKLGHEGVRCRLRPLRETKIRALAIVGVREEGPVWHPDGLIQVALEVVLAPAVIGERAGVLGPDDEHGVRVQWEVLDIPEPGHGPAEGPGEGSSAAAGVWGGSGRRLPRAQRR